VVEEQVEIMLRKSKQPGDYEYAGAGQSESLLKLGHMVSTYRRRLTVSKCDSKNETALRSSKGCSSKITLETAARSNSIEKE
jgi:hypothetical protein